MISATYRSILALVTVFALGASIAVQAQTSTPTRFNVDGKIGLKDETGKIILEAKYSSIGAFHEGMATATAVVRSGSTFVARSGFIDVTGKEVAEFIYDSTSDFHEGMARIILNGKVGFVGGDLRLVVPPEYDNAEQFSEGLAPVNKGAVGRQIWEKSGGKWGFIDKTGSVVIPIEYDGVNLGFSEGLAGVNKGAVNAILQPNPESGGKWGFIDKTGNVVIPIIYDVAKDTAFQFRETGQAKVRLKGKNIFINRQGQQVKEIK
jgi:WG containing repeat